MIRLRVKNALQVTKGWTCLDVRTSSVRVTERVSIRGQIKRDLPNRTSASHLHMVLGLGLAVRSGILAYKRKVRLINEIPDLRIDSGKAHAYI